MPSQDTKDRIISAAERLFSERGFAGTSLRTVTSEAGVNLAAVHYHFGTKDALLRAVFTRRIAPLNRQRLDALDALESDAGEQAPELEAVLEAFIAPIMDLKRNLEGEGMVWSRFVGRIYSEPQDFVDNLIREQFAEVGERFVAVFGRCLPELSLPEIVERIQFTIGAMNHSLIAPHRFAIDDGEIAPPDEADSLRHLITFTAAAFRAPAAMTSCASPPESGQRTARAS